MNKDEDDFKDIDSLKDKIRKRYQGLNSNKPEIIPALPQEGFREDNKEKRVAVYVRVSTDDMSQTSSFELQKNHYEEMVNQHPTWTLVEVYADEGISGTSLQHRNAFIRMIEDCHLGKIDLIVTKSVSRFARNLLDCIGHVRQLAALQPPVGVFFETENIFTLDKNSELYLSILSTLAQEESHNKSEIMNSSIEMRFSRGILLTPPLLGYDKDEDGNLIINEREAKTIRLIFYMYLYGYTCQQIAEDLTRLGARTKKGNIDWSAGSVLQILQNERHCGDVLTRKTWTPNYLDHKSRKNRHDRNQYRWKNTHEAIITRAEFIAVQHLISNAKYGNRGFLPELRVISDGALRGFVFVHPKWAGFRAEDYSAASAGTRDDSLLNNNEDETQITVQSGEFDLRSFEIARSQFFETTHKISATFSNKIINFSAGCICKLGGAYHVQLLVHPQKQLLAVRPLKEQTRNSMQWAKSSNGKPVSREIRGMAYLGTLYELFDWNKDYKYRVRGIRRQKDDEAVILFDMRETEVFIPDNIIESVSDTKPISRTKNKVLAYPPRWIRDFGSNYYRHAQARELAAFVKDGIWNISNEGKPVFEEPQWNVSDNEEICRNIQELMNEIEQEGSYE